MFAIGIENSYPTIDHGNRRVDELEKCKHYLHWKKDFELVTEMGIGYLRYGQPLHRAWLGQGRYDWDFADATFDSLRVWNIVQITATCPP